MSDSLRLDYSVECENCGTVEDVPVGLSEFRAQEYLRDKGWRVADDENRCPPCARASKESEDEEVTP